MSIVLVGSTSGSCTLQEQAVAGNTVLTLPTVSGTVLTDTSPKAGNVLQVIQATFTGTQLIATGGVDANFTNITNLSVTITPSSSSSKMMLFANINNQCGDADRLGFFKFTGGNTANYLGDSAGSRSRVSAFNYAGSPNIIAQNITMNYLDSPATTSAITYRVQACPNFSSGNGLAINYYYSNDVNAAYIPRGASSLIVMEIAG